MHAIHYRLREGILGGGGGGGGSHEHHVATKTEFWQIPSVGRGTVFQLVCTSLTSVLTDSKTLKLPCPCPSPSQERMLYTSEQLLVYLDTSGQVYTYYEPKY